MRPPLLPRPASRSALKEWAAVEHALETGATVLLLRKGGIHEQRQGFQLEHPEFWLFPTRYHQSADELAASFAWTLDVVRTHEHAGGAVRIANYAMATDVLRIESTAALDRLSGLHPLAPPTVHARFHYRRRPYLHALILRVLTLPRPYRLANPADYEGCVSWVELHEELSTLGAEPALTEQEFAERRAEILALLGASGVTRV